MLAREIIHEKMLLGKKIHRTLESAIFNLGVTRQGGGGTPPAEYQAWSPNVHLLRS